MYADLHCELDFLCITVDTDSVVEFVNRRKDDIKEIMAGDGVFVIEMLTAIKNKGYTFVNMMLTGHYGKFKDWPWSSYITPIDSIFKDIHILQNGNEIILISSNADHEISEVTKVLRDRGFGVYDPYMSNMKDRDF